MPSLPHCPSPPPSFLLFPLPHNGDRVQMYDLVLQLEGNFSSQEGGGGGREEKRHCSWPGQKKENLSLSGQGAGTKRGRRQGGPPGQTWLAAAVRQLL